jgi:hypothetical protein
MNWNAHYDIYIYIYIYIYSYEGNQNKLFINNIVYIHTYIHADIYILLITEMGREPIGKRSLLITALLLIFHILH